MCTIGIRRFGDNDYIVCKNKDFPRERFDDSIVTEEGVFGVEGVATWAEPDPTADRFSGMSVGANSAGLLCADANVRGATDQANYDELVETALRAGGGVGEGIAAVKAAVAEQPYMWANIVMIDPDAAAVVEVRDSTLVADWVTGSWAKSNHHERLGRPGDMSPNQTSDQRLFAARRRLPEATSLQEILELQRAHDNGGTGICNHQGSQTVYSYVLRRQGGRTHLYVTQGHPCEAEEPIELMVPLGSMWSPVAAAEFRAAYPSSRVFGSG
jgi:hypothetical protein